MPSSPSGTCRFLHAQRHSPSHVTHSIWNILQSYYSACSQRLASHECTTTFGTVSAHLLSSTVVCPVSQAAKRRAQESEAWRHTKPRADVIMHSLRNGALPVLALLVLDSFHDSHERWVAIQLLVSSIVR